MRCPRELATADTLEYLGRVLPDPGARVLEVGCGEGDVARELSRLGYAVVAVDADPDAVEAARSKDVDARVARFPDFTDPVPFDAVLFTRSLHHIAPLAPVYDRSRDLLREDGTLVVEDWAWNRVDRPTATWASHLLRLGAQVGLREVDPWVRAEDPYEGWHEEHGHHGLHFGETMWGGARTRFDVSAIERCPYFYRYFCAGLPPDEGACRLSGDVLAMERALIREGMVVALGMRFSGRRR